jgi:hypothetical protein
MQGTRSRYRSGQETESSPNSQNEPTTRLSTPSNMVDRLWRKRAQDDEGAPGRGIMFIEVAMDVQARWQVWGLWFSSDGMSKFDLGSGGPEWCFVEARTGKQPASRHVRPLSKPTQHLFSLREFCCNPGPTSALHISHRNTLVAACASLQPSMVMCARRRNVSDYSNM